ncbi:MAG: oligosaccharide flippase family protein [Rhodothermales bacterium]
MDKQFLSRFLKGSASTSSGTLVTILFHFVSMMVLARYMSKEDFGTYSLIIVIGHGLQILSGLGLNLTMVKFLSGEIKAEKKQIFSSILLLRSVQLAVVTLFVLALGDRFLPVLFEADIGPHLAFVPGIFVLASLRELLFHYMQGERKFGPYAVVQVVSALIRLVSIGVFLFMDWLVIDYLLWIEIITYGLSLVHLMIWVPLRDLLTVPRDRAIFRSILGFGSPLYFNDILTYIYNRTSVLLIGGLLTPISVAMYEVASKVPEGFGRLFNSLIVVYFPSMSELLRDGKTEMAEQFMNRSLAIVSAALIMASSVTYFFREEMITLLFSEQYRSAALVFALLMINFSLNTVSRLMGYTIVAAGYSSVPVRVNLVSSILNVVGCLFFLPRFGELGAVYSLFAMSVASQFLNHRYLTKAGIHATFFSYVRPIVILAVLIGVYELLGGTSMWLRVAMILAFPVLCWALMPEVRSAGRFVGGHAMTARGKLSRSIRGAGTV